MFDIEAIRIVPIDAERVLTPDQKRFNSLIRKIARARESLKAWHDNTVHYSQAHVQVLLPLQEQLRATRRQWAFALDAISRTRRWTRAECETLNDLVCETAGELLHADGDDADLKTLFAGHAQTDFDTERLQTLRAIKNLTESVTGLDLGDDQDVESEEDLLQRMQQGMQEQTAAADARRSANAQKRRKTAAQQRREDDARQATLSVREIFRKLASALHPDRESDARQREAKTALMQEVNQAYASNDLLSLLELQLRIEQIDAGHMANADTQRVKHYNKVLAEQLDEIEMQVALVQTGFCMDFGLEQGAARDPSKLGKLLERVTRELRAELAQSRRDIAMLDDTAATKRWLRAQRQMRRAAVLEMGFF